MKHGLPVSTSVTHDKLDNLQRAGLLHDIGKIGTPSAILDKPGQLTDDEYNIVKEHPRLGARILKPIEDFNTIATVIMQHHERFDGNGYPDGLTGVDINLNARILGVADAFDAMTSDRPYRAGMPIQNATRILLENSGSQFDPKVVDAFIKVLSNETGNESIIYKTNTEVCISI